MFNHPVESPRSVSVAGEAHGLLGLIDASFDLIVNGNRQGFGGVGDH